MGQFQSGDLPCQVTLLREGDLVFSLLHTSWTSAAGYLVSTHKAARQGDTGIC